MAKVKKVIFKTDPIYVIPKFKEDKRFYKESKTIFKKLKREVKDG